MGYEDQPAREATAAEAKALAHPVRIRILQALRGEPKTNKELAEDLGTSPGATLHHVTVLLDQGFVEMQKERTGRRGAREIPYETTGKTRILSFQDTSPGSVDVRNAILRSALDGYTAAPPQARFGESSVTLYLTPERLDGFEKRLQDVITEYAQDAPSPNSEKYGFFGAGYRHPKS
ncbi:ArsR/SmtB family transcription factor [Arthrobacter sp. TMS2-4]